MSEKYYAQIEREYVDGELQQFLSVYPDAADQAGVLRLMLLEAYRAGYAHRDNGDSMPFLIF